MTCADVRRGAVAPTVLSREAVTTIRRHASGAYPVECCGALLEAGGIIVEAFPLANTTAGHPRRRFLVGPDDYRAAEARAQERRGTLAGFYHSHPDHPARPSAHDLAHAWPNLIYLIVSVQAGAPGEIACWRLRDDRSAFDQGELIWPTES